jgi:hypothetical protein
LAGVLSDEGIEPSERGLCPVNAGETRQRNRAGIPREQPKNDGGHEEHEKIYTHKEGGFRYVFFAGFPATFLGNVIKHPARRAENARANALPSIPSSVR